MASISALRKLIDLLSNWDNRTKLDRYRHVLSIITGLERINKEHVKIILNNEDSVSFLYTNPQFLVKGRLNGKQLSRKINEQDDLLTFLENYI